MACALPSTASMRPRVPSSQHHLFRAYVDMGVRVPSQHTAGRNFVGPQMGVVINSSQKRSRNETAFFSVNGSGAVGTDFAGSSPEMRVIQGLRNGESGVGAADLMMPYGPRPHDTVNPILIELRYACLNPIYHDVTNPVKPPYSSRTLIAMAIESSPSKMQTVAEIYHFIVDVFPFYRHNTKSWQNTVRNKLSTECCFYKINRPEGYPGTGKVWSLHPDSIKTFENGQLRQKNVLKNETTAKKPLLDPSVHAQGLTHQPMYMGMVNEPNETNAKIQGVEMFLPGEFHPTGQVTAEYFSQYHQHHGRAFQNSGFSSSPVCPLEMAASLFNYTPASTVNSVTNENRFPSQQKHAGRDNQLYNHSGSVRYNYHGFVSAENNEQQEEVPDRLHHHVTAYNGASNPTSSFHPEPMDTTASPNIENNDEQMSVEPQTESSGFRYYFQSLALIDAEYPYDITDH